MSHDNPHGSRDERITLEYRAYEEAVEDGSSAALLAFLQDNPESAFRDAIILKLSQLKADVSVPDVTSPQTTSRPSRGGRWGSVVLGVFIGALLTAVAGLAALNTSSVSIAPLLADNSSTELSERKAAMLAAIEPFGSGGFSDSEARTAIAAASALTKDEIESDQEILEAVETTLDSFFGADRFDFAAQLEEAHAPLFREHAEFYVSFCLAYGLRILEQSPRTSSDLWSVDDRGYFNRNVEKYKEYAQLDVVRQRFPEYEAMYEPFIMRLEGASDAAIIEKMRAVDRLNGGDLNNFTRTMERYATGAHAVNPNRRDAVLVRQRIQSLIRDFHEEDPSGNWRRLGVLSGMDL